MQIGWPLALAMPTAAATLLLATPIVAIALWRTRGLPSDLPVDTPAIMTVLRDKIFWRICGAILFISFGAVFQWKLNQNAIIYSYDLNRNDADTLSNFRVASSAFSCLIFGAIADRFSVRRTGAIWIILLTVVLSIAIVISYNMPGNMREILWVIAVTIGAMTGIQLILMALLVRNYFRLNSFGVAFGLTYSLLLLEEFSLSIVTSNWLRESQIIWWNAPLVCAVALVMWLGAAGLLFTLPERSTSLP